MYADLEGLIEAGVGPANLRGARHHRQGGPRAQDPEEIPRPPPIPFVLPRDDSPPPSPRKAFPHRPRARPRSRQRWAPASSVRTKTSSSPGFFVLTEMERRILRAAAERPRTTLLFLEGRGIGSALAAIGVDPDRPSVRPRLRARPRELIFVKSPDTHGQVFALNGWLVAGDPLPAGSTTGASSSCPRRSPSSRSIIRRWPPSPRTASTSPWATRFPGRRSSRSSSTSSRSSGRVTTTAAFSARAISTSSSIPTQRTSSTATGRASVPT